MIKLKFQSRDVSKIIFFAPRHSSEPTCLPPQLLTRLKSHLSKPQMSKSPPLVAEDRHQSREPTKKKWPRLSQMCHHFRLTKHVSWPWHSLSCLSSMIDPVLICLVILDIVVNMKQPVANKQLWLDQMLSSMVDYLLDSYLYFIFVLEHSCQIQIVQIKII